MQSTRAILFKDPRELTQKAERAAWFLPSVYCILQLHVNQKSDYVYDDSINKI